MLNFVRVAFYTLIIASLVAINFNQLNLTKADETSPISAPITSPEVTPEPTVTPTPEENHDNGGSNDNHSDGGSNNGGGNSGPSVCGDQKPGAPVLLNVIKTGPNQVMLNWSKPVGSVSSYVLAYGLTPAKMLYGNPNVGNTNSYVVNNLQAYTAYYFQVRAANGCMPGDFSNTLGVSAYGKIINIKTAVATGFQPGVLSVSKSKFYNAPKPTYQPTIPAVSNQKPVEKPVTNFLDSMFGQVLHFLYR